MNGSEKLKIAVINLGIVDNFRNQVCYYEFVQTGNMFVLL